MRTELRTGKSGVEPDHTSVGPVTLTGVHTPETTVSDTDNRLFVNTYDYGPDADYGAWVLLDKKISLASKTKNNTRGKKKGETNIV